MYMVLACNDERSFTWSQIWMAITVKLIHISLCTPYINSSLQLSSIRICAILITRLKFTINLRKKVSNHECLCFVIIWASLSIPCSIEVANQLTAHLYKENIQFEDTCCVIYRSRWWRIVYNGHHWFTTWFMYWLRSRNGLRALELPGKYTQNVCDCCPVRLRLVQWTLAVWESNVATDIHHQSDSLHVCPVSWTCSPTHGPLARYVTLRVAHAAGMPGTFSLPLRVSDPNMHHGTWCMPWSLASGFLWSRWRGKRSRHYRCMRNPQFYVSSKRPIAGKAGSWTSTSDSKSGRS